MEFIKEWWFIIAFTISAIGALLTSWKKLNETLLKLSIVIETLSDNIEILRKENERANLRIDRVEDRVDKHDIEIEVIKERVKGK